MSIMTRCIRIWKADIHGVMDQLEDKGLLLRQCLRDMESDLEIKQERLNRMKTSLSQARQELGRHDHELTKHEQDLQVAIEKDRDDIARMLIKKIAPLKHHCGELSGHIERLESDVARHAAGLDEQRLQSEQMQLRAAEYFRKEEQKQWQVAVSSIIPQRVAAELSEEEVELVLLKHKEVVKQGWGGVQP